MFQSQYRTSIFVSSRILHHAADASHPFLHTQVVLIIMIRQTQHSLSMAVVFRCMQKTMLTATAKFSACLQFKLSITKQTLQKPSSSASIDSISIKPGILGPTKKH